ncbi:MAG: hypothetical protein ACYTF3_05505 [Planctomycetota bacterium]
MSHEVCLRYMRYRTAGGQTFDRTTPSVDAYRVAGDPERAARCLARIATDCEFEPDADDDCREAVFDPPVACCGDEDCGAAPWRVCARPADETAPGECTGEPEPGLPCEEDDLDWWCPAPLVCFADGRDLRCDVPAQRGAACVDASQCAAGLYCAAGSCQPLLPIGAPCAPAGDQCSTGYCGFDDATESYLCTARPASGEACRFATVDACPAGEVCVQLSDGRRCRPPAGLGAECSLLGGARFYNHGCRIGLRCDADTETCQPAPALGEPCDPGVGSGPECAAFETQYCDRMTARCALRVEDGEACSTYYACVPGAFCDLTANVCRRREPPPPRPTGC